METINNRHSAYFLTHSLWQIPPWPGSLVSQCRLMRNGPSGSPATPCGWRALSRLFCSPQPSSCRATQSASPRLRFPMRPTLMQSPRRLRTRPSTRIRRTARVRFQTVGLRPRHRRCAARRVMCSSYCSCGRASHGPGDHDAHPRVRGPRVGCTRHSSKTSDPSA